MADDIVYTIARTILDEATAALTAASRTVPARSYVSTGEVAYDCDQITARLVRIFPGFLGAEGLGLENRAPCARPRAAEYLLELVRCFPALREDASVPQPGAIEAASIDLMTDAYVLMVGLAEAAAAGSIAGGCDDVAIGSISAGDPSGGMAAVVVSIQVQLF